MQQPLLARLPQAERVPWRPILVLSFVAFCINCQPSEPYLTRYLKEVKDLTDEELDTYVWPADSYGAFAFLLPTGFFADIASYPVTIGAGLACREATRVILLFAQGLSWMVLMQVTYAAATSANAVLFAFVYQIVTEPHFKLGTTMVHAAYHLGNALGSGLGQLLVSHTAAGQHLRILFFVSWGFTSLGVAVFVLALPQQVNPPVLSLFRVWREEGWRVCAADVVAMYQEGTVLVWSVWWSLGFGAAYIAGNYYQTQFSDIDEQGSFGTVELVMELCATAAALAPLLLPVRNAGQGWLRPSVNVWIVGTTSLVQAALYVLSTRVQSSVYWSYCFQTAAFAVYSFQYALASLAIARSISSPRYAFVFVLNTFVALGIITIAQAICAHYAVDTAGYFHLAAALDVAIVVVLLVLPHWRRRTLARSGSDSPENTALSLND
eukprot:m.130633 g.130633  ORF g.130633 m.130633 type:complete len:437 (-) comp19989_c0_seq4:42-1352(-)